MREVSLRSGNEVPEVRLDTVQGPAYSTAAAIIYFNPLLYLADVETAFPSELALFREVGIHPEHRVQLTNPYTNEPVTENFQNIGEHCLAVAYCAYKIADALHQAGHISEDDQNWIVSRALVHDLTKPYEIMRRDAQRAGAALEVYTISAYEKLRPLLIKLGVPDDIAEYLIGAGRETGHNSLKDFILCRTDGSESLVRGKLAEKIVHLADDMTFTSIPRDGNRPITSFFTCWERMLASQFFDRYSFLWKEGLARDERGALEHVQNIAAPPPGKRVISSYADLQVRVANAIAQEIQLLLDPSSQLPPENFVKNLVNVA